MIVLLSSQAAPRVTSTTSPSANLRPSLMMVFKSEPSGFAYARGIEVSLMEKAPFLTKRIRVVLETRIRRCP
jgi:hypothetical protein